MTQIELCGLCGKRTNKTKQKKNNSLFFAAIYTILRTMYSTQNARKNLNLYKYYSFHSYKRLNGQLDGSI